MSSSEEDFEQPDDFGGLEPYQYEPDAASVATLATTDQAEEEEEDERERRIGNCDW